MKQSNIMSSSINNKRIAKNTLVLYIRMLIVTVCGLYTSRIILKSLGIDDYGLYSVVGGVVTLFSFFRSSMEKCTQRYLNIEMAKPNGRLRGTFNNALIIHMAFAIIAFVFAETIGLWFLNTYLNIPLGREFAANCVYQTVVGGLVLTIMKIPYSASIISNERMGLFAFISLVDCILNLLIAFLISYSNFDRLIYYSFLLLFANLINFIFYIIYCNSNFSETKLQLKLEKDICREMLRYTSWTLLGHAMIIGTNQGNSILVNMFHGVSANAAMAVANQVNSHVLQLTGNFQTAFNPQITKTYASDDKIYLQKLIFSTSKLSYYLLLLICLPLMFNIDRVLDIWLDHVPVDANIFCILMLSSGIIQATTAPLNFGVMASGQIKWFQIVTGCVFISDLFFLYALFSLGMPAPTAMIVKLGIMMIVAFVRMFFSQKILRCVTIISYSKNVLFPLITVTIICVFISYCLISLSSSLLDTIFYSFAAISVSIIIIILLGMNEYEKEVVKRIIIKKLKK